MNPLLTDTLTNVRLIAPEMSLIVAIMAVIGVDLFFPREKSHRSALPAVVGLCAAFVFVVVQWQSLPGDASARSAFYGAVACDHYAAFFKLLFYAATLAVVVMSAATTELSRLRAGEYYALLLTATVAASFLVSVTNWLMLFLAIETLSLPSYVLAGYRKGSRPASEAALKYVLFGAVASGIMLYGISLVYGLSGSLEIGALLDVAPRNYPALLLTTMLLLAGFGFKMSVVPFHFWAPDVYQGAPTPITAYLSVVSKAAGFAVFLRILAPYFGVSTLAPYAPQTGSLFPVPFDVASVFWVVAVITMTVGNFVALRQTDMKRLLAYSSIAHAGYMITAFVAYNRSGFHAILFYFVVYFIANVGLFAAILMINQRIGSYSIADYRGLFYRAPLLTLSMGVLLWSLIGLPPTAGFVGKWKLFYSVVERGQGSSSPYFFYSLVLIALVNSVVSLVYYIAIVKQMCFHKPGDRLLEFRLKPLERLVLVGMAVPILALQLQWEPVTRMGLRAMNMSWEDLAASAPAAAAGQPAAREVTR